MNKKEKSLIKKIFSCTFAGQSIHSMIFYYFAAFLSGALLASCMFYVLFQKHQWPHQLIKEKYQDLQNRWESLLKEEQEKKEEYLELVRTHALLTAEKKHWEQAQEVEHKQAKEREEKLLLQFERLSNQLLEQKKKQFTQHNKEQMEHLLAPLKERITSFQQEINAHREVSIKGQALLKQEFDKVFYLYDKVREENAQATQAIIGDNKLQGHWGEMHALQMLENSGLKKGEQYVVQEGFTSEEGKRYIPDIIIKLPGNRHIVMDVKISLLHYTKYFNAKEPRTQVAYLKKHIQSIKNHIKQLSKKNYARAYHLEGLDFVLLLLPIEPAFSVAIQEEPSLFQEAYEQNVVLVSPTTLRATLSMIEQLWTHHHQNQHALEIAAKSGALYDKFAGFVEDLKKIGQHLEGSQKIYDQALKKLSTGKGNLLKRTLQLKALGAKASKEIDPSTLAIPTTSSTDLEPETWPSETAPSLDESREAPLHPKENQSQK